MKRIYILGGDILTSEGDLAATWKALAERRTPLLHQLEGHRQPFPLAIISTLPQPFGSAARLQTLLDRLYLSLPTLPADTALVCATTKAAVDEIFPDHNPSCGQIWQVAAEIGERLGITGTPDCISAACASGTIAVIQAAMKISSGECDHALVVGFDLVSTFVLSGFAGLKALSPTCCRPFDKKRDGLALGEGAGWMLLSRYPLAFAATGRTFTLSRWGISCDATHITAPCRNGSGLIRSLQQTGAIRSQPPGAICAHGTGTVYNDAMELLAFHTVWDKPPPTFSVKGTIGHCLGAAGIIESCLSIKSLLSGHIPPTAGLCEPEDNGRSILSGREKRTLENPSILSCNSGFGGINAALLFTEVSSKEGKIRER